MNNNPDNFDSERFYINYSELLLKLYFYISQVDDLSLYFHFFLFGSCEDYAVITFLLFFVNFQKEINTGIKFLIH